MMLMQLIHIYCPEKQESSWKNPNAQIMEAIEHPLIYVLSDMEIMGFKVDRDMLVKLDMEFSLFGDRISYIKIYRLAGRRRVQYKFHQTAGRGKVLFDEA